MLTTERVSAGPVRHPRTTPGYDVHRNPCVYRLLGVPGTARVWAEDLGAVVIWALVVALWAAALWLMVGR
ncbi:MAG: hypothetical protein QME79_14140 [Bacillota bacterium]|nr:hypothetical protein [Bacillota bacterium]